MFAREGDFEIEVLDLSRLASEYGRTIIPVRPASRPRCRSATRPAHVRSQGSETLLRIRSLAGYTIDTHESRFRKRQPIFAKNGFWAPCVRPKGARAFPRCDLIETSGKIARRRRLTACPGDCLGVWQASTSQAASHRRFSSSKCFQPPSWPARERLKVLNG